MHRIYYDGTIYALRLDGERPIDAVCRSVCRRNRASSVTARQDSWAADGSSSTYQLTIRFPGGGYRNEMVTL